MPSLAFETVIRHVPAAEAVTVGTAPTNAAVHGSPAVTDKLSAPVPRPPVIVNVVVASGWAEYVSWLRTGETTRGVCVASVAVMLWVI